MAKTKHSITRLREVLDYKPRKGYFVWKIVRRRYGGFSQIGDRAGSVPNGKPDDRTGIGFEGVQYRAHILAYAFMNNKWPPKGKLVDHINGNATDNRWCNLRLVTRQQNRWNTNRLRKNNRSGKAGVSWNTYVGKWLARIVVNMHAYDLGWFEDKDLHKAIAARRAAELKFFGEYAPQ